MINDKELEDRLIEKSKEAFMVAIELYNKPTIKYRVEGFSFFICNAWELLLKAKLIKDKGQDSIYYKDDKSRTISLSNCIEQVFTNNKDPLRINLERIIDLRNISTHFVTVEYEQIYVPLFQSCVINYTNKLLEFFDQDITDNVPTNFLTLSIKLSPINADEIKARYPERIADKLLYAQKSVLDSTPVEGNNRYAVIIRHDLYITKKADLATASIAITKDASKAAFILKESKDMQKSCPYQRKKCIAIINNWIQRDNLNFINPSRSPEDSRYHSFTANHFNLFADFYNLKTNPKYCYSYDRSTTPLYSYSEAALQLIFDEIKKDPENIIQNLKSKVKKIKSTPGAKEF